LDDDRLPGGNLGGAVRVGETVRKPAGAWTAAVDTLLRHLESRGFLGAPRSFGIDEQDRHVLSYVEGETVGDGSVTPWPAWCWSEDTLTQVGSWLREYHEAVSSFSLDDAVWRFDRQLRSDWTICHNDIAPYNAVWRDGLVAFIDWDIAGPGDPAWDVAQAAWHFAPLHHPALTTRLGADVEAAPSRARRLLDAYGVAEPMAYVEEIPARIRTSIRGIEALARIDPAFARLAEAHMPDLRRTVAYVETIRSDLAAAFG
jgi:Phosphotransferase enzyme family